MSNDFIGQTIKMKLFFFDTETTGLNSDDQILQFSGIFGSFDGENFYEERRINQFINVSKEISPEAEGIHGISKNKVENFEYIDEYIDEILLYIKKSDYIIGHNVEFDIKMLKQDCKRIGQEFDRESVKSFCTMKETIDILNLHGRKRPKLSELYRYLFGKDFDNAHDAMSDIEATKDCFIELVKLGEIKINMNDGNSGIKNKIANMAKIANEKYCPLLTEAVISGDREVVEYLLNNRKILESYSLYRTDIDIYNEEYDSTPLMYACRKGDKEIAELLIKHGANIEATCYDSEITPLKYACLGGNKEIVKLLIKYGASIEAKDKYGKTTLIWAGINGNSDAIDSLLAHGANIEAKDNHGKTALTEANARYKETLEALLLHGANIEVVDEFLLGDLLRSSDRYSGTIKLLLSHTQDRIFKKALFGNTEKSLIIPFISGGDGSIETPFILMKHKSYVSIEYIIISFIYGEYKFLSQTIISPNFLQNIDVINIEFIENNISKQRSIYFDLTNNRGKHESL